MRRSRTWLALALGSIAFLWAGWRWIDQRRYRGELEQIDEEIASGRYRQARQRLVVQANRGARSSRAAYQLGLCEEKLGRPEAALAAWASVEANSPLFLKATIARCWILIHSGRLARAEEELCAAAAQGNGCGPLPPGVRAPAPAGRPDFGGPRSDHRVVARGTDPSLVLRRLYILDDAAFPLDYIQKVLERGTWRRPRLAGPGESGDLARAVRRGGGVARRLREAAARGPGGLAGPALPGDVGARPRRRSPRGGHLASTDLPSAEVLRLRAWFARSAARLRRSGRVSARSWPTSPATPPPGPGSPSWRWRRVDPPRPAPVATKGRVDRAPRRYTHLLDGRWPDSPRRASSARLARELGRRFEARGWSLIRNRAGRDRAAWAPISRPRAENPGCDGRDACVTARRPRCRAEAISASGPADRGAGRARVRRRRRGRRPPLRPRQRPVGRAAASARDDERRRRPARLRRRRLARRLCRPGRAVSADRIRRRPDGDRLFRNRGDGTFEDVDRTLGHRGVPAGLRPRRRRRRLRQRRPPRPVRHPLAVVRPLPQPRRRDFEDVTGQRRPGRRPRLADLGGLRRPRRRRRPRPLRLPLPRPGTRRNPERLHASRCASRPRLHPARFPSLPDHVFRNDGGRFVDVTGEAGIVDRDGRGLGVVAADLDDDGRVDLYVANDMSANYLFRNLGGFRFEETGQLAGVAANADGRLPGGDGGRLRRPRRRRPARPGRHQLLRRVDDVLPQPGRRALRRPDRGGRPRRRRAGTCWASASPSSTLNNDGRLDLVTANGHVNDGRPKIPWTMPLQLLLGGPGRPADRRLRPRRGAVPVPAPRPRPGRRRPRQRRPGRRPRAHPERAAGLPPQPDRGGRPLRPIHPGRDALEPRGVGSAGRRSMPAGDDSCPSGSAAAATSRRATPGSISASGRLPGSTPSRCAGRRDRWIDTAGWTQTWSIGFARASGLTSSGAIGRRRGRRITVPDEPNDAFRLRLLMEKVGRGRGARPRGAAPEITRRKVGTSRSAGGDPLPSPSERIRDLLLRRSPVQTRGEKPHPSV